MKRTTPEKVSHVPARGRRALAAPLFALPIIAALLVTGCTASAAPSDEIDDDIALASFDLEASGFTVEEETNDLVLPYGIAVAQDRTTFVIAGEPEDRYLVIWHPETDEWRVVLADEAGFDDPRHISVSPNGDTVYVANAGSDSISVGKNGASEWSEIRDASFNAPFSIAIGLEGELAVVNAGDGSLSVSLDGGSTWESQSTETIGLPAPTAIDVTPDGTVVIVDAFIDAVAVGENGGETWRVVEGISAFDAPVSVDTGPDGKIYVANSGNGSLAWSEDTGHTWSTKLEFGDIAALAVGPEGSLFVTDGVTGAARVSTTPGPVENIRLFKTDRQFALEWDPLEVTGGQNIAGYIVSLGKAEGDDPEELRELTEIVEPHVHSVTFSDVEPDGLVAYVQAVNDNGAGVVATKEVAK